MYIADLHIHSKYSRATSKELEPEPLDAWARRKGIGLVGTGDFTHPTWREVECSPCFRSVMATKGKNFSWKQPFCLVQLCLNSELRMWLCER